MLHGANAGATCDHVAPYQAEDELAGDKTGPTDVLVQAWVDQVQEHGNHFASDERHDHPGPDRSAFRKHWQSNSVEHAHHLRPYKQAIAAHESATRKTTNNASRMGFPKPATMGMIEMRFSRI